MRSLASKRAFVRLPGGFVVPASTTVLEAAAAEAGAGGEGAAGAAAFAAAAAAVAPSGAASLSSSPAMPPRRLTSELGGRVGSRASGHSIDAQLGAMALVSASVPNTEIDLQEVALRWGSEAASANFDQLNTLTSLGVASDLDDPLFFYEEADRKLVIFPKRYNRTYATADYEVLFFGLDAFASSGTVAAIDGGGLETEVPYTISTPPITMVSSAPTQIVEPEANVAVTFFLTNNDGVSHDLDFSGISAQSRELTATPSSFTLAAGETRNVVLYGTLDDWPEGVGDMFLLRARIDDGAVYTDLIGGSLMDTIEGYTRVDHWLFL